MTQDKLFQRFFRDDDERAAKWFQHFKFSGENEYGAVALERYLFDARNDLWEKLRWNGKRDVTPCVAVQKKNLLMELDVLYLLNLYFILFYYFIFFISFHFSVILLFIFEYK